MGAVNINARQDLFHPAFPFCPGKPCFHLLSGKGDGTSQHLKGTYGKSCILFLIYSCRRQAGPNIFIILRAHGKINGFILKFK